jgi:hypothetical protein
MKKQENPLDAALAREMRLVLDKNALTIKDLGRRTGLNDVTVKKVIDGNLKTLMLNYVIVSKAMGEQFSDIYGRARA